MSKILSVQQIRALDSYTIENEPISSIDLMERASAAFCEWYVSYYSPHKKVAILCGMGNNGGDGLAIGRIFSAKKYPVQIFSVGNQDSCSQDFKINLNRLEKSAVTHISQPNMDDSLADNDVIIDAMFGSGLSRPLEGIHTGIVDFINQLEVEIVSVDIASGLFSDKHNEKTASVVKPLHTVAFQIPKLSFLLPQNHLNVGEWHLVDIGLSQEYIDNLSSDYFLVEKKDVGLLLRKRSKYDHKGTNGRAMIVAGSYGKVGAAVLSARGALRSGLGLLTMYIPRCGYQVMQTAIPEAMVLVDGEEHYITTCPKTDSFDAIGIGPGIGTMAQTAEIVFEIIRNSRCSLVLDADALNILSEHQEMLEIIPKGSILTPHPKEFERLVGKWKNDYERLSKQQAFSRRYKVILLLKGAHTSVSDIDGRVYFNTTGNPGMATAGSGDALLGIITSLLAQGLSSLDSAILGAYIHGLAGDYAAKEVGEHSLIASDIIQSLPKALMSIPS